jgi:copper chaperone NosL
MKRLLIALIPLAILTACSAEPRPIVLGQDACHHCKMTLMDPKLGKVFVFDDVNCMLGYMESDDGKSQLFKHVLVMDYVNPGTLIDAKFAHYLKSSEFKTPMASEVVAFPDFEQLKEYKAQNGGLYLAWGELTTQFK